MGLCLEWYYSQWIACPEWCAKISLGWQWFDAPKSASYDEILSLYTNFKALAFVSSFNYISGKTQKLLLYSHSWSFINAQ